MLRYSAGFLLFIGVGNADMYLQNPKGSNNRLNEKSANRNNANRVFDSQNNNRGGYNVPDIDDTNGFSANNPEATIAQMYNVEQQLANRQYNMLYQEGSMMRMSYTAQHGCGNSVNNCNMLIQYGCDTDAVGTNFGALNNRGLGTRMIIRNGGNTNAPDEAGNANDIANKYNQNNNNDRGRFESEEFYYQCEQRGRNTGLFLADQKLKGANQVNTRQNPNGNRSGLECPEERDYYPWNYPSPWKDIMWKGNDVEYCKTNIAPFSQNISKKGTCTGPNGANDTPDADQAAANDPTECAAAGGQWVETSWGDENRMTVAAFADQFCQAESYSQANHLGNADNTAKGGQMASTELWLPSFEQLENWGCHVYTETINGQTQQLVGGALRQRYNISTMDYDPYTTDASFNNDPANGVISPITQNPTVDVGAYMQGLQLAINTAQTGRTFQDRTHKFYIVKKPTLPATGAFQAQLDDQNMLNVNVRGKRGNIVQTFPAIEYDFEPNDFSLVQGQCMHLQWAGSNTHNNGNPAGDGQAGDAGEGRGGSDRSNIMEMKGLRMSYPMTYDQHASFFDSVNCKWPLAQEWMSAQDAKIVLATAGYYTSEADAQAGNGQNNGNVDPLLNNVSGAFRQGMMCCTRTDTPAGDYYFLSTRNNNFSNRAQKMKIKVVAQSPATAGQGFQYFPAENVVTTNIKPITGRRRV